MKKIIPILIVGILVFSGLGAATTLTANETTTETEPTIQVANFNLNVANPTFKQQDEFTTIELAESEAFMSKTGEPMLPVITKTFAFPVGTTIKDVNVDITYQRHDLDRKVTPTPIIAPTSLELEVDPAVLEEQKINEAVYESASLYPAEQYEVRMGAGLQDMEHVIFVNVKCYPQYSPANDYVKLPTQINIDVEHETAEAPPQPAQQYDMIIITHDVFEEKMQRLVDHKESVGISTTLVTVDEIYDTYDGAGEWEEIKMYLAEHVKEWDTKFVLLAGGHRGQTHEWYVPDFRSRCWNPADAYDPPYDETYSSDLYYADVYYADQYGNLKMETWDSNGNGIYAEGPDMPSGTDVMDFYPDVHLGRLPLRYVWEADVAIDKIIAYETGADDSWFKTAVLAGGDGFPPERYGDIADPNAWEGEIVCDVYANLLANRGVTSTKTYCSDQGDVQVTESRHVYNEVSKGAGFVHLTGHASPFVLGSYTPGYTPLTLRPFYAGLNAIHFDCGDKLPFMVNEGCHNAQFDVTGQELLDFLFDEHPDFVFGREEWIPHDVSSWFVLQEGGGAIGVIGNTALGLGGLNYGCTEFVGGWIMLRFAEGWGVEGLDHMGAVWTYGINGYISNFDVSGDTGDRKTVEERALLGDPSVLLGGYGSSLSEEDEESETVYGPVSAFAPTWSVGDSWTYALDNVDIDLAPIEERALTLKLSAGDINLEVTEVTSEAYITSLTSENIDVTVGGMFDFHIDGMDDVSIPTVSLDNVQIDGQLTIDKENLGIKDINLGLIVDLIENLDNFEDLLGLQLPGFIDLLTPYMEIPANIDVNVAFDDAFEIFQFPLENGNTWGIEPNTVTVTIDGSVESVWLRILSFVNNFVPIIPEEFAQYLPNVDISEVLEDMGIDTVYEIEIPEIPEKVLETYQFEVWGTESISTQAGTFNAAKVAVFENNGILYYDETEGNLVKFVGQISEYVPLLEDINLELKQ